MDGYKRAGRAFGKTMSKRVFSCLVIAIVSRETTGAGDDKRFVPRRRKHADNLLE